MKYTNLKRFFELNELKQSEICRKVGIHPNSFSRIVNGKCHASHSTRELLKLCLQKILDKKEEEHQKRMKELKKLLSVSMEEICPRQKASSWDV